MNPVTTTHTTPVARRLRADAERNNQRIVSAGRELFAENGVDFTLDQVAERAGVGVGSVYRRYANKRELVEGIFEELVCSLVAKAESSLEVADPWDALVEFFAFCCEQMAANRGLGEIARTSEFEDSAPDLCIKERLQPALDKIVERARSAGQLRPDAEPADFIAMTHMVDAVAAFSAPVNPQVWRRYFHVLLDGLRADDRPRQPLTVPALTNAEIQKAKMACFNQKR